MNRPLPQPSRPRWHRPLLLALALAAAGGVALAADLRLQATLIWGADDCPTNVNYNLADPALAAALRSCKPANWTNYYIVTNLSDVIALGQSKDFPMNGHCTLKIRNLGSGQVAIDCTAHDKEISRGTNTLPLILVNNETNKPAWFVSLRDLGAPATDTSTQLGKK